MIPTTFEYARATSLDDALAKLKAAGGGGKFIAGGHSLVPLMKLRLSEPQRAHRHQPHPGARGPSRARRQDRRSAPATVHHDVATSPLLRERCPVVADAAATIGDPQVRNRGTMGGSLAHADPSADMPAVMAGARRGDPSQGTQGLARREGSGLLRESVYRGYGDRRDHRERPVRPGAGRRRTPSSTSARRTTPLSASLRRSR